MAGTVTIKVKPAAMGRILQSEEVARDLERRAAQIAAAAGSGHEVVTERGPHRIRVEVRTATFRAMQREASYRSLTQAIDAGRH